MLDCAMCLLSALCLVECYLIRGLLVKSECKRFRDVEALRVLTHVRFEVSKHNSMPYSMPRTASTRQPHSGPSW
jgi:hypothetical protein